MDGKYKILYKLLILINMKQIVFLWIMLVLTIVLVNCKDNSKEDIEPQPLTNYTVTSINGGVRINYPVHNDDNILYVMVEYERNGKIWTERSSIYKGSLTIQGFHTIEEVKAQIYTVNYYEKRSNPVTVTFTPLESPLSIAFNSLKVEAEFGGVLATWENPTLAEFGIRLMMEEDGVLVDKEMYFSSIPESHPFREYEDVETTFAFTFEDKYGNVSDTLRFVVTPLPEAQIPIKSTTASWPWKVGSPYHPTIKTAIPYDSGNSSAYYNSTLPPGKLFDNVTHILGTSSAALYSAWLTAVGDKRQSPIFTIDMGYETGKSYKLSRMKIWPRMQGNLGGSQPWNAKQPYTVNNVLAFEMYGIREFPVDKLNDKGYWLEPFTATSFIHDGVNVGSPNFTDEWVYLGRYELDRLDLMGASDADIVQRALDGNEFKIQFNAEPVRYIRFIVLETDRGSPSTDAMWEIAELRFWGTDKVTF